MLRIAKSFLTIVAVAVVAVGATGAYFSDQETIVGNSFTAGSLDLQVGSATTLPFSVSDVVPGQDGQSKVELTNAAGSIPATLDINLANFVQYENTLTEPELNPPFGTHDYENGPNAGELDFFLQMAMFVDVNKNDVYDAGDFDLTYNGQKFAWPWENGGNVRFSSVSSMLPAWTNVMTLNGGDSINVIIQWQFPGAEPGGNYSQSMAMTDGLSFDTVFTLNQL